jgi:hypothetical protein
LQKPKSDVSKSVLFNVDKKGAASNNKRAPPKSASPQLAVVHAGEAAYRMLQTAWWIVEPVFNLESGIWKRWEKGDGLTWRDMGVFAAAAIFVLAALLAAILSIRVLLVVAQVVRAFWSVLKVLAGF